MNQTVDHPAHYNSHPSGVETIDIVRHLPFDHGNVLKYVMRRDGKEPLRSLHSAAWYLEDLYRASAMQPPYKIVVRTMPLLEQVIEAETHREARIFYRSFAALLLNQCESTYRRTRTALERLIETYAPASEAQPAPAVAPPA